MFVSINNCKKFGFSFLIQLLLERGANLEAEDEDGGIPLHDACAGG
jgi:ankyrin repeat protein